MSWRCSRRHLGAEREAFGADPERATAFLSAGESPPDPGLDPVELAAWTSVASLLLNLDETITRR